MVCKISQIGLFYHLDRSRSSVSRFDPDFFVGFLSCIQVYVFLLQWYKSATTVWRINQNGLVWEFYNNYSENTILDCGSIVLLRWFAEIATPISNQNIIINGDRFDCFNFCWSSMLRVQLFKLGMQDLFCLF